MHKDEEKDYKFFFVEQSSSPAVLGMSDIDNLGILTIGRKLPSGENTDNNKRNCQHKRAIQTEGRIFESYENRK